MKCVCNTYICPTRTVPKNIFWQKGLDSYSLRAHTTPCFLPMLESSANEETGRKPPSSWFFKCFDLTRTSSPEEGAVFRQSDPEATSAHTRACARLSVKGAASSPLDCELLELSVGPHL